MKILLKFLLFISFTSALFAQNETSTIIKGKVIDSLRLSPVSSAEIVIPKLNMKTISDENGNFRFNNVKEGDYEIITKAEGYFSAKQYVLIPASVSIIELNIILRPFESILDTIEVNSKYFKKDERVSTGFINVGYDEIKKAPGTIDDIIRHFESSPGVAIGSDMANQFMVRGGAPIENQIIIDNIELPNPNHFSPPGTNSGAFSYINIQMINEANFYTGGFPVLFGDKLSSVMDIKLKDGSTNKHLQSADMSLAGFGLSAEGPVTGKMTYALSVRRSYFEFFKSQFNNLPIPNYWDVNFKLNYRLDKSRSLSFTSLSAIDNTSENPDIKAGERQDIKVRLFANGINYENIGNKINFRLTGFYNYTIYGIDYYTTGSAIQSGVFHLDSKEHMLGLDAVANYQPNHGLMFDFISGIRYYNTNDTLFTVDWINESDYSSPAERFNRGMDMFKGFAGVNMKYKFFKDKLIFNGGLRGDYNSYLTHHFTASPRAGLTFRLNKNTSLNGSAGLYCETPEILWLICDPDNKDLLNLKVYNFVAGAEHYFLPNFRINTEIYYKQYENYPVDLYNPILMYINSGTDVRPNFIHRAVSKGNGYFTGIDLSAEYKNGGSGFYGILNLSLTTSGFAALEGGIQPGEFDYGKQLLLIAGYQIKDNWSFGMRLKYSGPRPMVCYDTLNSYYLNMDYYDKTKYLKVTLPYYMRVDLRVDKMFRWGNINASIYAEVENVLNRKNIFTNYWNDLEKQVLPFYNLSILPVLGFNIRF
ncbi:MAG: TonB-dependent receptor [Ignavibacteria bacterium]